MPDQTRQPQDDQDDAMALLVPFAMQRLAGLQSRFDVAWACDTGHDRHGVVTRSAGASCLRRDGSVWTTDKDGIVLGLRVAEMTAVTGRDPGELYRILAEELGDPAYERIDAPATAELKTILKRLWPEQLKISTLEGEPITAMLTRAPGNDAPLGGLKLVTESGCFAVRPSGTEDACNLYAERFRGTDHLHRIQAEAKAVVEAIFADLD